MKIALNMIRRRLRIGKKAINHCSTKCSRPQRNQKKLVFRGRGRTGVNRASSSFSSSVHFEQREQQKKSEKAIEGNDG